MLLPRAQARDFTFHGLQVADYPALDPALASVTSFDLPPNSHSPWTQSTRSAKLHFISKGKLQFNVDGVVYNAKAGDLVLVPSGAVFRCGNWWKRPARLLVVSVPPLDPAAERVLPDTLRAHQVRLLGERVRLRPMTEDDWEPVLAWNSDPEVLIWSDEIETPRPPDETKDIYRSVSRFAYVFIIEHQGQPVGDCWLQKMNLPGIIERFPGRDLRRIDLAIGRKDLWNRGLGTDAIKTLVTFGFERERADAIFGLVSPKNKRSWRAFEKAGFTELEDAPEPGLVIWRH